MCLRYQQVDWPGWASQSDSAVSFASHLIHVSFFPHETTEVLRSVSMLLTVADQQPPLLIFSADWLFLSVFLCWEHSCDISCSFGVFAFTPQKRNNQWLLLWRFSGFETRFLLYSRRVSTLKDGWCHIPHSPKQLFARMWNRNGLIIFHFLGSFTDGRINLVNFILFLNCPQ